MAALRLSGADVLPVNGGLRAAFRGVVLGMLVGVSGVSGASANALANCYATADARYRSAINNCATWYAQSRSNYSGCTRAAWAAYTGERESCRLWYAR
jgi:hypothetical protein